MHLLFGNVHTHSSRTRVCVVCSNTLHTTHYMFLTECVWQLLVGMSHLKASHWWREDGQNCFKVQSKTQWPSSEAGRQRLWPASHTKGRCRENISDLRGRYFGPPLILHFVALHSPGPYFTLFLDKMKINAGSFRKLWSIWEFSQPGVQQNNTEPSRKVQLAATCVVILKEKSNRTANKTVGWKWNTSL